MKRSTFLLDSWHKRVSAALASSISTHSASEELPLKSWHSAAGRPHQASLKALRKNSPAIAAGAEFGLTQHRSVHGQRAYRLYVPASAPPGPRPLLIMLHGCTQNSKDFALGTRMNQVAEEKGVIVAYPEQARSANMSLCWNWFQPTDQARGSGEPAILASIVAEIMHEHDINSQKIFVAGLSAGGAMAAVLGETYPDLFQAVGVHSGLPYRSAHDIASAISAMRMGKTSGVVKNSIPKIVFHGANDGTVHPENGVNSAGLAEASEVNVECGTSNSRRYVRTTARKIGEVPAVEHWSIQHLDHAWSGGDPRGSFTDALGPDASREMIRFFLDRE
ncbi:extracellular catalytic domain type 1 short-chain-length polyhydroxyalkanoate depolymerase [Aureimonas frigidaquae]|uniref:extracellular catalytic domain type 1 short-chain-length polyhydroxyalkanoate depolymerase n=1 Tax=Aureimonas frigidaquae TaxID=424757 RepID=UPI000B073767|nr:PHB depolymerase family esterase [Aureimonas frigidaquae]